MPCYNPLVAWRYEGKITFNPPPNHLINKPFNLPCAKCIGCRFNYARSWALRCQLEALSHKDNCFITLTFSNEELLKRENPWSVDVKDFQKFMKKFRKRFNKTIRFFHCGEYGEKTYRPHYHALLFGHDFRLPSPTNKVKKFGKPKYPLYESTELTSLWGRGHTTVGELNFDTASYTARYVTKKIKGDATKINIDRETGEVSAINDVYCTMSRGREFGDGIGGRAYKKYKHNWYPNDFIVNGNGIKMKPPRYFDKLYQDEYPDKFEKIKIKRKQQIDFVDQSPRDEKYNRLKDIENVKLLKLKETLREIDA
jgi:hypothetical protein